MVEVVVHAGTDVGDGIVGWYWCSGVVDGGGLAEVEDGRLDGGEDGGGSYLLIAVIGYIAAFAISVGPVTWVVISEIFPTQLRGTAMSIATGVLWLMNWIITQTFPIAIDRVHMKALFRITMNRITKDRANRYW